MFRVLEPVEIAGLKLENHFVRSATTSATADETGAVTEATIKLYEQLAEGHVGLIVTGMAFVSEMARGSIGLGVHHDGMIPGLRRLVRVAHERETRIALQIGHCGGNSRHLARLGLTALAPALLPERPQPHRPMTEEEIAGVVDEFAAAARRAQEASFDAVQLHGCYGYLLSQFFSPLTNRREDRWGGSAENRRRFHAAVVAQIRAAVGPRYPVWIKFGIMDDAAGGAPLEEGLAALEAMVAAGLDAVEISGGIGSATKHLPRPFNHAVDEFPYHRARAAAAKRAIAIPVAVVGGIRSLGLAEEILAAGDADLIALSRPLIREPALVGEWLHGGRRRAKCVSCWECDTIIARGEPLECGQERRLREQRLSRQP